MSKLLSTRVSEIKQTYGLITGADLPPRPKPPDEHAKVRERWAGAKKLAFREMGPAALCIVATDGPVSVVTYDAAGNVKARFGHNRGCWPVRVATTGSFEDRITEAYNKNPFVRTGVQIRVWAGSAKKRDALVEPVTELLAAMAEEAMGAKLVNGFLDIGPEVDMEILEVEIHAMAERLGIAVWDDEGLSAHLDRLAAEAERRMAGMR